MLDANAAMFFAGSPQVMRVPDWKTFDRPAFWNRLKQTDLTLENICIHAHYLINLANLTNAIVYQRSLRLLLEICAFAQAVKVKYIILHPGAALKSDRRLAMEQIAISLKHVLTQFPGLVICLETMSGKGSEIGRTFEELQFIIRQVNRPEQVEVCWDTCHLYSAGYDIKTKLDAVLTEFDAKIGLNKLRFIHLNDTFHPLNSRLDRHAKLGEGLLGTKPFARLIRHPQLANKVWILETPHQNNPGGYKSEIALLRSYYEEH